VIQQKEIISQTAEQLQTSKAKVEEFEKLLFKALRSFVVNPINKNRIVMHYFGVFDFSYKKAITELKNAKNSSTNNNFLYELYQKWWKADND
jgi:nucleoid DNA-binding protein